MCEYIQQEICVILAKGLTAALLLWVSSFVGIQLQFLEGVFKQLRKTTITTVFICRERAGRKTRKI